MRDANQASKSQNREIENFCISLHLLEIVSMSYGGGQGADVGSRRGRKGGKLRASKF